MKKTDTALNAIAIFGLMAYLTFGLFSFFWFVKPSMDGINGWRAYGDSDVYRETAVSLQQRGAATAAVGLLSISSNLILPSMIAAVLGPDVNIVIFNFILFGFSIWMLVKTFPSLKWYVFLPLVFASGTTFEALFTLNKEIFAFFSAVLIARWFKTRSPGLALSLIILSALLRWEQAFVIIVFFCLIRLKISPRRAALILLILISAAYPAAIAWFLQGIPVALRQSTSSTLYERIDWLQSYGLYFLLVIPKAVIALLSQIVRFWQPFLDSERLHDLNNGAFVLLDQLCFCAVVIALWRKREHLSASPICYFGLVYGLIYLAAPMNQPRYLYMLFILMAALVSSSEMQSLGMTRSLARTPRMLTAAPR